MLGFVNKLFISVQLIVFLDHVLLLAELAQKFKLLQNSCMAKWFHETELQGINLYHVYLLSALKFCKINWLFIKIALTRKEISDIVSAFLKPIRYNQLNSLDSKAKNTLFHVSIYRVSLLRNLWLLGLKSFFPEM